MSQWANAYRVLPLDSPMPGRYRTEQVPYFKEVMDAFTQEGVRRIAVKSSSQTGKALDELTPIATSTGFKLMRDIQVGDKVFDERGEQCKVVGVSPIMYGHDCYEVTFSDGARIIADAEHNWYVQEDMRRGLEEKILPTAQISCTFKKGERNRYAIPVAKPLQLSAKDLPIDPYTLGCWLGDGNAYSAQLTLHEDDLDIARRIEVLGHRVIIRQNDKRLAHVMNIQIDPLVRDENICIRGHDMRIMGKTKQGYCAQCQRQFAMEHKWRGIRDIKVDPVVNYPETLHRKLRTLGVIKKKHVPPEYLRGRLREAIRNTLRAGKSEAKTRIETRYTARNPLSLGKVSQKVAGFSGTLSFSGKRNDLSRFELTPRRRMRTAPKGGVHVRIVRGQGGQLAHAFLQRSGKVYERLGRPRYPIKQIKTLGLGGMTKAVSTSVVSKLKSRLREQLSNLGG